MLILVIVLALVDKYVVLILVVFLFQMSQLFMDIFVNVLCQVQTSTQVSCNLQVTTTNTKVSV